MKNFVPLAMLQVATFAWDANTETNLAGYKLLGGPRPGIYNQTNVVGRTNTFTVSNMPPGQTFWVVVAVDTAALESDPSNEVTYTRPLPPLTIKAGGGAVTLSGIAIGFRLQEADAVTGPWRSVTNGVRFPIANTARFFSTTSQ